MNGYHGGQRAMPTDQRLELPSKVTAPLGVRGPAERRPRSAALLTAVTGSDGAPDLAVGAQPRVSTVNLAR